MFNSLRKTLLRPRLSIVVIVYRMPDQASRTLYTFSARFQREVREADYEVIVVENSSDNVLGERAATQWGHNFRYFYREESSKSPVNAVNFGVQRARAPMIAVVIDGARLVTPGVVANMLRAGDMSPAPVVSVPGYHLGRTVQQEAVDSGYDEQVEAELLRSIDWPSDGYALFDIACLSGSCGAGFFKPYAESNCLCMPKWLYKDIGGCDPRFDLPGGGNVNLDLYRRAADHPKSELIVLPGEGSFHQYHGGITTNLSKHDPERQAIMRDLNDQYEQLRGEAYAPPQKPPIYLGRIPPHAQPFVRYSASKVSG